jgi:hypothetical protein
VSRPEWEFGPDWSDFRFGKRRFASLPKLLALVAGRLGDEDAAKRFIARHYAGSVFQWLFDPPLEIGAPNPSSLKRRTEPRPIQDSLSAARYFWLKPEYCASDWKSGDADYDGPLILHDAAAWPSIASLTYDHNWRVQIHANLVQLPADIAIEVLRALKFAPTPKPLPSPSSP